MIGNRKRFRVIFLLLAVTCQSVATERLIWINKTSRSFDNIDNDRHISTISDAMRELIRRFDEIEYEFQVSPELQIKHLMKVKATYCLVGKIKTAERSKIGYFSHPITLYQSFKLYFSKDKHIPEQIINEQGQLISLKKLFEYQNDKKLIVLDDFSYGKFLDQQISELSPKNVTIRKGVNQYNSIVLMSFKNRVDYAMFYPASYQEYLLKYPEFPNLSSISIQGSKTHVLGRVMCSKNELGKKAIKKINKILDQLYQEKLFYQMHVRYLHPDDIPSFDKSFQKVYIDRNF